MSYQTNTRKGFTLIELLVVIAIIGILSSIVLAVLSGARASARDVQRNQDIRQIQTALEMYYNDNGKYPTYDWRSSTESTWNSLAADLEPYIDPLPVDPVNDGEVDAGDLSSGKVYNFFGINYGCSGQWYMIVYELENSPGEDTPGVTACNGSHFEYGGSNVRTVGVSG